jgi:putative protease
MAAGVSSMKVEGRMKSAYYVAAVTRVYRWAIDAYLNDPAGYRWDPEWLEELGKASHRGFTTGFYFKENEKVHEMSPEVKYIQTHDLIGIVQEYAPNTQRVRVGVRNQLGRDDLIELLLPDTTLRMDPTRMTDCNDVPIAVAHNDYQVYLPVGREVPVGAVLRRKLKEHSPTDL